ncbi:MAG: ATP-binding protein [Polaromonas sp.]
MQLIEQLLRKLLTGVLLLGIPTAWCSSTSPILITGLNDVTTSVSWLRDSRDGYSINDLEHIDSFKFVDKPVEQWFGLTEIWLRIDISTSSTDSDRKAYLQVKPAFLYDVQLYQSGVASQRQGLGLAFNKHSSSSLTPLFFVELNGPVTRVYLRMSGVSLKIVELKLMSEDKLIKTQQSDAQINGVVFGAMLLMALLNFFNWCFTREKVYLSYLFFISSSLLFFLLANSFVSAYLLPDQPMLVLLLLKLFVSCVISSTIFLSVSIFRIEQHSPRLARGLHWLSWTLVFSNLCINDLAWLPLLIRFNIGCHLLCSILFLFIIFRQVAEKPSAKNLAILVFYLVFTLLDKYPLLLMSVGLQDTVFAMWLFDLRKIAYLLQFLPMHLLIIMQLLESQKLKAVAELKASKASIEAQNASIHRANLNRFLGLLGNEIRTPLAVIDSAVQTLELQPGALEPERQKRHLRIRGMVQKLNRLVADSVDRERIESAGWHMKWSQWAVSDLLNVVLPEYDLERPSVSSSQPSLLPLRVGEQPGWLELGNAEGISQFQGDLHLLQIALTNLVDNACKYAEPGSTVKLVFEEFKPSGFNEMGSLRILVLSRCPGLNDDDLTKLFSKYSRHESHKHLNGSGLGLSLVQHIMHLHSGTAKAKTIPDAWNCFFLEMPLQRT